MEAELSEVDLLAASHIAQTQDLAWYAEFLLEINLKKFT
jgi:hypothetical protein